MQDGEGGTGSGQEHRLGGRSDQLAIPPLHRPIELAEGEPESPPPEIVARLVRVADREDVVAAGFQVQPPRRTPRPQRALSLDRRGHRAPGTDGSPVEVDLAGSALDEGGDHVRGRSRDEANAQTKPAETGPVDW